MFVYHGTPIVKVVRFSYIIAPYREGCSMFVYHNAPIWKVVRCSYILTPSKGRLLDVRI